MISCTGAMWVLSLSQAFINPETVLTPVIITGEPEPSGPGVSVCLACFCPRADIFFAA